jgi:hypothetical protein
MRWAGGLGGWLGESDSETSHAHRGRDGSTELAAGSGAEGSAAASPTWESSIFGSQRGGLATLDGG